LTARAVVDIVGRILALTDESPSVRPQVTCVRVDEVAEALEILDPPLRHVGGTVLNVGEIARVGSASTIDDAALETRVCSALEHTAGSGTRTLAFDNDRNGRRRAFWSTELGSELPSEHTLLGLATAAIDERLGAGSPLLVVFYDEAGLEPVERRPGWDFVTRTMPSLPLAAPDHFVVVVAAERPQNHHLSGDPSLRWSADGDHVVERMRVETNRVMTRRLIEERSEHLVLFLAAGFSKSMGMPLGNKMRDFALRKLLPGTSAADLPRAFYDFVADQGRLLEFEEPAKFDQLARDLTFERVLREELATFSPSPTLEELERLEQDALRGPPIGALRHLKAMLPVPRRLVLITVNFDRLIENDEDTTIETFVDDASFAGCVDYLDSYLSADPGTEKVPLLKLHGSFDDQETLIASIEHTLTGLTTDKSSALDRACRPSTSGRRVPFVYVGSSMRDLDVTRQLSQPHYATDLNEGWVMPLPAPSVTEFVHMNRSQAWRNAGAATRQQRMISWTADEFFEALAAGWA